MEQAENTGMKFSKVQKFAHQQTLSIYAMSLNFINIVEIFSKTVQVNP